MKKPNKEKILEILSRGVVEIINRQHLFKRLLNGGKLRIKFGIDPTGPNIHLGRGATIKKLKEFQNLGHQIILIIGDGTARVGDSSDKTAGRKMLTDKEIRKNEKDYLNQIGRIIDLKKTEIHHNSEWINSLTPQKWVELASLFTIQQMIERDNFAKRIKTNNPVGYQEGLYSMLQGYDSVIIKADLEIGGTDQLFNLLAGRKIQKHFKQKPQDIMTLPLLAGTDGRKMSTSWSNIILIKESPAEKFGKIMSLADYLIPLYLESATEMPMIRVKKIQKALESGKDNPLEFKKELAYEIVKLYDGENAAKKAQKHFEHTVQKKQAPIAMPLVKTASNQIKVKDIISRLVTSNIIISKSEGKRLLSEGAISIDGIKLNDNQATLKIPPKGLVVKAGKRRFLKIIHSPKTPATAL